MKTKVKFISELFLWAVLVMVPVGLTLSPANAVAYYLQVNLTSDGSVVAANTDPNLINPWGISYSSTSPFWVSDNGTGVSTLYNGAGQPFPVGSPLVVSIPPPAGGTSPSTPTGLVFNGASSFELTPLTQGNPARFLFATEDGTISGWNPATSPTSALREVDNSASSIYTGLAIGNNGSGDFLYASNFEAATIDVFDSNFSPSTLSGSFIDPNLPAGYAPFNVQNLGGSLFVTYAMKNGSEVVSGPGYGLLDIFDLSGNLVRRLISDGALNSPWGVAQAPAGFGDFSSALLVGNFGDGRINAFDPATGAFLGYLQDSIGDSIAIDGLRGLIFGDGGNGGDPNTLYFTAGPNDGQNGLFGSLAPAAAPVPEPTTMLLLGTGLIGLAAIGRRKLRKS
jgi:uncharacterized protein (TIGR03118 family)